MIERPTPSLTRLTRDRVLAVDQHESARAQRVDLVAGEKRRKPRQQILEVILGAKFAACIGTSEVWSVTTNTPAFAIIFAPPFNLPGCAPQ
jgi:hypothetical protein